MLTEELQLVIEQLTALAQSGLAYTQGEYDRDRYEKLYALTGRLHELVSRAGADDAPALDYGALFPREIGYRTPKVDLRAVVLREDSVLLVHERTDGKWSLPGGWADVGETPTECVIKEVLEESGFDAKVIRLLALLDQRLHAHGPSPWHTYKVFYECEVTGSPHDGSLETHGAKFFPLDGLPALSTGRVTEGQLHRLARMIASGEPLPWFD